MARIVVLNGPSSSGKTAVARAFQELAPALFLNISIDTILYALPPSILERMQRGEKNEGLPFLDLVRAYCASVRAIAETGQDLIIDHAVTTRAEAELLLAAVEGHATLFVGLRCATQLLAEREGLRGDRRPGLAESQLDRVHQWLQYDLEIDTAATTPEDAARQILEALG
jgi:chloramphenicol 3-O phosphotransferase